MKVDIQSLQHVFQSQGYSNEEGAFLLLRAQLLKTVKEEILRQELTQAEAAKKLGVKQPRISEIFSLRIDKFSIELLIRYLYRLNKEVTFTIKNRSK